MIVVTESSTNQLKLMNPIVFLLDNFAGLNKKFEFREGGAHDVGKVTACFGRLGFHHDQDADCKTNITCEEMRASCKDWAKRDYRGDDCVIVVILTHGESPDKLQGVDGEYVALDDLLLPFNYNPTLVGKPKIFFIQACRGRKVNMGIIDRSTAVAGKNTNNYMIMETLKFFVLSTYAVASHVFLTYFYLILI